MRPRTLRSVLQVTDGALRHASPGDAVSGVAVDSREVRPGDLFFALPGDRADGHRFVTDAIDRGAVAGVVRRGWPDPGLTPVVEVEDPGAGLLALARDERGDIRGHVVGITGSTGKTCTKDLTAAVLAARFVVTASPASFNNEVGLPLTLLSAGADTEAVVCEMGSRGPGHIRLLCEVARPTVGIVTNVGVAHMQMFGSREVLRDAKAELPEALPEDGVAVLNADDPTVRTFAARTPAGTVVWFGRSSDSEVRAESVQLDAEGRARFDLVTPEGSAEVRLSVPGEHMVANALAAAAVGWSLGVDLGEASAALSRAAVSSGRMEEVWAGGVRILNDAYNANPTSMSAALRAARWIAGSGRCLAVLGPMAELGPISDEEHERVGELVVRLRVDVLVAVGAEAGRIAAGALREGVEPDRVHVARDVEEAEAMVATLVRPGDLVLVKGSRVARMERVAEALAHALEGKASGGERSSVG